MLGLDLVPARGQRDQLAAQPSQHPPHRAVIQAALIAQRRLVAGGPPSRAGRLAVRLPVVLQIGSREMEQRRTGVALTGEDERTGNR